MSAIRKRRSALSRDTDNAALPLVDLPMTSFLAKAINASRRAEIEANRPPKALRASPMTSNVEYSEAEFEFLKKLDEYKRRIGKPFVSNTEIFALLTKELGYSKLH